MCRRESVSTDVGKEVVVQFGDQFLMVLSLRIRQFLVDVLEVECTSRLVSVATARGKSRRGTHGLHERLVLVPRFGMNFDPQPLCQPPKERSCRTHSNEGYFTRRLSINLVESCTRTRDHVSLPSLELERAGERAYYSLISIDPDSRKYQTKRLSSSHLSHLSQTFPS